MSLHMAVGLVELNSIAQGIEAADAMVKAAEVTLHMARPTCPGRYAILISGETAAVGASVATGKRIGASLLVDSFVLAQLHPDVIPALSASNQIDEIGALGIIETATIAAAILAADGAAKAAEVAVMEIRFAAGLAGKSYMTCTGAVSAVEAAVEAGIRQVGEAGPVLVHKVIPAPDPQLKQFLL